MTEDAKKNSAAQNAENTEEKGRAEQDKKELDTTSNSAGEVKDTDATSEENEQIKNKDDDGAEKAEDSDSDDTEEAEGSDNAPAEDEAKGAATEDKAQDTDDKNESSGETQDKAESKDEDIREEKSDDGIDTIEIEIKADANKSKREEFQAEIREQIENCKFEIIGSLQDKIHEELQHFEKQARKLERRRRAGVIVRNIIILVLAAIIGFFAYCLYDAKYFAFMKSECEQNETCETAQAEPPKDPEVKNAEWYKQNYGYLFDSLQTKLNADKVSAYYLYTGDYKVNEIEPEYLLGMAYNRLNSSTTYDSSDGIVVPANDLRQAYIDLVGNADNFTKTDFTYHCADFLYRKESDDFTTKSLLCADTAQRQIVEEIDEIYEEGNVLYFLTTATIYDKANESFYSFDNLFKPVVKNVNKDDLAKHKSLLDQYQYQFKKSNGKYHFGGVTKLK